MSKQAKAGRRFTAAEVTSWEVPCCDYCGELTTTKNAGDESLTWCKSCGCFEVNTVDCNLLSDGTFVPCKRVTEVSDGIYEVDNE